jgi:hypothetical protein
MLEIAMLYNYKGLDISEIGILRKLDDCVVVHSRAARSHGRREWQMTG